ncbi:MAG: adenylate/guanylate cyclase domain-containing protein [Magnetococcus sp. THC-1_WYH]
MKKRLLFSVVIVLVSFFLSWLGVRHLAVLGIMEHWLADIRIANLRPPEPQHPDIIILSITEETLALFPYRSPVDRAFLADTLERLETIGVRGILMDLLLDQPTEPEKDARLRETLKHLTIPLMVSYGDTDASLTPAQIAFQEMFIPPNSRGLANLLKDSRDQMVRWVPIGETMPGGNYIPAVAEGLAMKLGVPSPGKTIPMVWHGAPDDETEAFRSFPIHMLPVVPPAWFKDKIILIGADLPMTDRHRSPLALKTGKNTQSNPSGTAGVVLHAHSLAQILDHRQVPQLADHWQQVWILGAAMLGVFMARINGWTIFRLLMVTTIVLLYWGGGFILFQKANVLLPLLAPTISFLLAFAIREIHERQQDRQQKKFLKEAFSKYLSPQFVDHLVNNREFLSRRAERRELTFLFTDIEGFTTMSEKNDPAIMAGQMNHYLDGVCNICLGNGGMVVDLIGDAVFSMFNAPVDLPDHAQRAVKSAQEIQTFTQNFQQSPPALALGFGRTRIGLHTGMAQVGNFGSTQQFKYTPLGDAVNIAARIEGLNKFFGTDIALSEATVRASGFTQGRPLGRFVLKGKEEALIIHEIPPPGVYDADYLERYRIAFPWLADNQHHTEALAAFEELAQENPADTCVAWYLARLRQGLDCSCVVMTSK